MYSKEYEKRLYTTIKETPDEYQETGQISGSKIAQPTLTAVLTMLGVEKEFDGYTLAKFMRGHDVEEKFIERVFHKPKEIAERGCWECEDSHFEWQYEIPKGYRGSTCSIDVLETVPQYVTIHEIKSVGKMKYDNVTASGLRKKGEAGPDHSHCLQVSLYALSLNRINTPRCLIHYVNADDYRVATFEINPYDYKEELDSRIDAIYHAFTTHELPEYIPFEAWQKGKYNSFNELENLSKEDVQYYVKKHYPSAYDKFMNAHIEKDGGINYGTKA